MFNIYDFFNSSDVAAHCKSIGHAFNALETAIIVYHSNKRTLKEKHAAYRTIISEFPDVYVEPEEYRQNITSLHEALALIMEYDEQNLEGLLQEEPGAIYRATLWYEENHTIGSENKGHFRTYEEAVADALKPIGEEEAAFLEEIGSDKDKKPFFIEIRKITLSGGDCFAAALSPVGDILNVNGEDPYYDYVHFLDDWDAWLDSKYSEAYKLLSATNIHVPLPFKQGDIVEIDPRTILRHEEFGAYVVKNIDATNVECYFVNKYLDGGLEETDSFELKFYPNLQYCQRELNERENILKYVSLYVQDKINICALLKIQKYLFLDKGRQELKYAYDSTQETLRLDRLPY